MTLASERPMDSKYAGKSASVMPVSSFPKRDLIAISHVLAALANKEFSGDVTTALMFTSNEAISRRAREISTCVSNKRRTG